MVPFGGWDMPVQYAGVKAEHDAVRTKAGVFDVSHMGEFRVHYAGFFDPGFGHDAAGGQGSRGVLEVRCHEAPFVLEHGQVVGRLVYERMTETPDMLYGREIASNYQGQGLKLSKHFKAP